MITTRIYLDSRKTKEGETAQLKIAVSKNGSTAYIMLGVHLTVDQWDKSRQRIVNHPQSQFFNAFVTGKKLEVEKAILQLDASQKLHGSAVMVKNRIISMLAGEDADDTFAGWLSKFAQTKTGRTRQLYDVTEHKIRQFEPNRCKSLTFDEINVDWLTRFDVFLAEKVPSRNGRNIHLRNIRAVFNYASNSGATVFYPFRKFKIHAQETPKLAMNVEDLRTLFSYPAEKSQQKYLDIFKLIFLLIGINIKDLFNLKEENLSDGRITYRRAKTHKLYSIKVEPEAMEIILRYKGKKEGHLLDMADRYQAYENYAKHLNDALRSIGPTRRSGRGGRITVTPLFPSVTTYTARHSWATIADSMGIERETIAQALGHGYGNRITSIYIKTDPTRVDVANRRVIDWVLYSKK